MARMTMTYLLIIIGVSMASATELTESAEELLRRGEEFSECRRKAAIQGDLLQQCFNNQFTPEDLRETGLMFNKTDCVKCMLFCRKKDIMMDCIRETAEGLKKLSNRSREMVPFVLQLGEATVSSFCDNEGEIMSVLVDEENQNCMTRHWKGCRSRLQEVDDLDRTAFCDFFEPEEDIYTAQFMCQRTMDFLECALRGAKSCSTPNQNALTTLISKLKSSDSCSKYL